MLRNCSSRCNGLSQAATDFLGFTGLLALPRLACRSLLGCRGRLALLPLPFLSLAHRRSLLHVALERSNTRSVRLSRCPFLLCGLALRLLRLLFSESCLPNTLLCTLGAALNVRCTLG